MSKSRVEVATPLPGLSTVERELLLPLALTVVDAKLP